ncbi:NmrA family NAD(P)-binding protein [Acetobacter okinawensis]|uniref:NmrA family NAD(P)-binding protein n=1 Tax=Acetobacter okinawensis TaxID=1076594 RepID=UPI0038D1DD42
MCPPQKPLQMIASDDIGKWVAMAFANFEDFIGKSEEIAGDELTYTQIVRTFRRNRWFAGHHLEASALRCA